MSVLQELYQSILDLDAYLNNQEIERDEKIQNLESLLIIREPLLHNIPKERTPEEEQVYEDVIKLSTDIKGKLDGLFLEVKKDLNKLKNSQKYSEKSLAPKEGVFFDQKR